MYVTFDLLARMLEDKVIQQNSKGQKIVIPSDGIAELLLDL